MAYHKNQLQIYTGKSFGIITTFFLNPEAKPFWVVNCQTNSNSRRKTTHLTQVG